MKFYPFGIITLSLLAGWQTASAQTSFTHSGSTDPATENWRPYDPVAGVNFNYTSRSTIGPVNDGGVAAWHLYDDNDGVSTVSQYEQRLASTGGLLADSYWRYSAYVKALPCGPSPATDNSTSNCSFAIYTHTYNQGSIAFGYAYGATMYDNGAGTMLTVAGNANGNPGMLNLTIPSGYNWIEFIHSPVDGHLSLYVNGVLRNANTPWSAGAGGSYGGNIVDWGDLIQTNGGYGGGNWAQVDFTYSPTALAPIGVPEPSTVATLLLGGAGVVAAGTRRKRRGLTPV